MTTDAGGAPVRVHADGPVLTITLDAPARRHALTPEMICRLADAFIALRDDDSLRVAIVTATGTQAFCAGGDLARTIPLLTGARAPEDDWDRRLLAEPQVWAASGLRGFDLDKPVIAAINGTCVAAGFELMLGTDLRVAAEHARFALPEVQRGVLPFAGSMARLPRQLAHAQAMEILLTGEPFGAADALRFGLVNRVVPMSQLMPTARALADRLARNGPLAVRALKRVVTASSGVPLPAAYALEDAAWREVLASEDAREGPLAFMEKREPRYRGR